MALTLLVVAAATAAVGAAGAAAAGVAGGISSYRQQQANAESQQNMLEYNANQERIEAKNVERETQEQDKRLLAQQEQLRATQRALYGKSGAAMYAGSPLALLGETAANQRMESNDLRRQGATEYNRRMSQAQSLTYQGRVAGSSVDKGQLWGSVGGSLFSGLGGVGGAVSGGIGSYSSAKTLIK